MTLRRLAEENLQPKAFEFSASNLTIIESLINKYPMGKKASAILPVLDLAQRQNDNWLSLAAIKVVSEILEMPMVKILEVVTFYTMYNLSPVGKHVLQVCTTTPCWLRGSDQIYKSCKEKLGINFGETTKDREFTLVEVECLGACANAPVVQINDDYYEDLDKESIKKIIEKLKKNLKPTHGPQSKRVGSEPLSEKEL
tara:strand:- start:603 stop:1196 length:594 start_codon:yes stop_codon:yes gene_type:complete